MSREANEAYWKSVGDKRSRDERIQAARSHSQTQRQRAQKAITMDRVNGEKNLTPQEKLEKLDWRLGKGKDAKKERARLTKEIISE